ncbi:DNA cytosine methyltransferase [Burkholderia ubonensis]|uniref:DNA cytosine methyltransferase n=1 Tax=Burkholderia ubonensis TaxID=101571 RepID=UPI0009B353C6|nr:DNA cytosine methyltransferase [Burkholderia ubonensis]
MSKQITFIDAFAGCGGLSLGLMQAGLIGKFAIEHDSYAFSTLKANLLDKDGKFKYSWPRWLPRQPIGIASLLSEYSEELIGLSGKVDLLVGGPPCQGFSMAGRRQHDDPRNQLFNYYIDLVKVVKPKIVLIENVRGFTMDFSVGEEVTNYAETLRGMLADEYVVYDRLIDVSRFGVPQARTRYFVIAIKSSLSTANPFQLLDEKASSFLRVLGITAPVSAASAISDLEITRCGIEPSRDTEGFNQIAYARPLTRYQKLMNGSNVIPNDLRLARHSREIAERFQKIIDLSHAEGRLNKNINADLRERFGIKKKALRVLDPDRPSPTITSMPDDLIHYHEPRTLTVRENARLQSFPDWYSFHGKYTTGGHRRKKEVPRFTQVANAVPPLMARAIGEMLISLLESATKKRALQTKSSGSQRVRKRAEILSQT